MILFGERLREERERLGLTQDRLGVTPQAQRRYEKSERYPDLEYLNHFASLGGDVLYVVTGQRTVGAVSADEASMLAAYRAAPEAFRKAAHAALLSGNAPDTSISIKGGVGHVIRGDVTFTGGVHVGGKKK